MFTLTRKTLVMPHLIQDIAFIISSQAATSLWTSQTKGRMVCQATTHRSLNLLNSLHRCLSFIWSPKALLTLVQMSMISYSWWCSLRCRTCWFCWDQSHTQVVGGRALFLSHLRSRTLPTQQFHKYQTPEWQAEFNFWLLNLCKLWSILTLCDIWSFILLTSANSSSHQKKPSESLGAKWKQLAVGSWGSGDDFTTEDLRANPVESHWNVPRFCTTLQLGWWLYIADK